MACPACGHEFDEPDPTSAALQASLDELRDQVGALSGAARRTAVRWLTWESREALRVRSCGWPTTRSADLDAG